MGSEMCIRDRGDVVHPVAPLAWGARLCVTHDASHAGAGVADLLARRHLQLRAGACLLYTSDAADERSSVDLGGRRIIKKKHNIQ